MTDGALLIGFTLCNPPAGVMFSLQNEDGIPVAQQISDGADISFDVPISVRGCPTDGCYLGEFVRSSGGRRYIYCASGKLAGHPGSRWERRAKIMLDIIDTSLVKQALATGGSLHAVFSGTAVDGGPACGALHPVGGWTVARA